MSWKRVLAVATCSLGLLGACGDNLKPGALAGGAGEIWVDAPDEAVTSEQGGELVVELVLSTAPTARVLVSVTSDTPGEGIPSVNQVVFEEGDTGPKALVVRGVDDGEIDGAKDYQLIFGAAESADARFRGARPRPVQLRNLDNDVPLSTVTVSRIYDGTGRVTSTPAGLDCPGQCSADFAVGTAVTLTATAASGSRPGGWLRGGAPSFGPTLALTLDAAVPVSVSAGFVRDEVSWLAALDGAGAERLDALAANGARLYAAGDFTGATTIAGRSLANGGGRDGILIAAASASGAVSWIRTFGGSGDAHVTSVVALDNGDVLAGGWFTGQLVLDATTYTASGTGSFLVRLDENGGFLWSHHITQGPNQGIAEVGGLDDGGVVACGAGAAPIGWYDGAGGYLAATAPAGLSTCSALDKRLGGWFVAGWGGGSAQAAFASVSDDRSSTIAKVVLAASGPVIVDDVETLAGGGALVAVVEPALLGHRAVLLQVAADGTVTRNKALGASSFARSLSLLDEGSGVILAARRSEATLLVLERLELATFDVLATFRLEQPVLTTFQLAGSGARRFLLGASAVARPLPGRELTLAGALGSFFAELKLVAPALQLR